MYVTKCRVGASTHLDAIRDRITVAADARLRHASRRISRSTPATERAVRFYSDLFHWTFTKWAGPADYWLIETGPSDQPGINGGLLPRRGPSPSPAPVGGEPVIGFVGTIDVESVDATVARGTSLGGTVGLPKMPIPGVGWLAYLKDPEGNVFGVMQRDPAAK